MLRALPLLALVALAACDDSTHPEDRFSTGRAVVRVERDGSRGDLTLDAPVVAVHVVSALDSTHAFTAALAGDIVELDEGQPSPMLELFIPGPLAQRSYPVGLLDVAVRGGPTLVGETNAMGTLVAGSGGRTSYFVTTGGSVDVVDVEPPTGRFPGHIRASLALELRELSVNGDMFGIGSAATGRGTLDGLVVRTLASDAEVAFSGAFSGVATRDMLGGVVGGFTGSNRDLLFFTGPQGGNPTAGSVGALDLHLARIPAAGETLRFVPIPPQTLRQRAGTAADSVSGALLEVFGLAEATQAYVSTAGQLRVESATSEAVRGTLTLTLTQMDRTTGQLGTRTITASGRVGIALAAASPLLSRARSLRPSPR